MTTWRYSGATSAPLLDPLGDNWWLQGYNRPYYEEITGQQPPVPAEERQPAESAAAAPARPPAGMVRMVAHVLPRSVKKLVPAKVKEHLLGAR